MCIYIIYICRWCQRGTWIVSSSWTTILTLSGLYLHLIQDGSWQYLIKVGINTTFPLFDINYIQYGLRYIFNVDYIPYFTWLFVCAVDYENMLEKAVWRLGRDWDKTYGWGDPMPSASASKEMSLYYKGEKKKCIEWVSMYINTWLHHYCFSLSWLSISYTHSYSFSMVPIWTKAYSLTIL